jgi:outer membrane protein assembly factor BamB
VGGGLVFAAARDGSVSAFDAVTGARRWRRTTGPLVPFPWGHESGDYYVSSPAFHDGVVIFGAGDGAVYAVDARTGTVRWRAQTEGRVRSSPAIADHAVYVGSFDGRVYCFELATGARKWRFDTQGATLNSGDFGYDRRSIQSSPAVANGTVYIGARDGFLYALYAGTGALRWRFDHKISWVNSSPAVADAVVFAGSSDGHFLQAVSDSGRELWRAPTGTLVWSSPAVAGSVVYVGDGGGRLSAFDRTSGALLWSFRPSASVYSSPAVSGEYVVVGSSDGGVYALRATDGPPVQRAVFFDTAYSARSRVDRPEVLARYLGNRGYTTLDSAALTTFLTARVADRAPSVVVFAMDYATEAVLGAPAAASLLRRYLDAGGKVVWLGVPPRLFPRTMPPGQLRLDWATPGELTGVPHDSALFDTRGSSATAAGLAWGLPPRWRDAWSVAPGGVTTVLGMDEWGLASAWVKRYGGPEGTGFVRVPAGDPFAVYLAAEYRR